MRKCHAYSLYAFSDSCGIANQSDITKDDIDKAHELVEFYVGSMDNINEDHKQGIFDLGTDSWFLYGTHKTIKYLLQYGVTVYQYVLTYGGKFSWSQLYGVDPPQGVCHGDDLIYLWNPVSGTKYMVCLNSYRIKFSKNIYL